MDYATVSFPLNGEQFEYPYVKNPEELQYIIDNPVKYIKESIEEDG